MAIEPLDGTETELSLEEDTLPPMEITSAPGFLRFMPELIKNLHNIGGKITLNDDGSLSLDGFYRNGPMKMIISDGPKAQIIAVDRRNRKTEISTIDDLVKLNYSWWKLSNRRGVYLVPERPWLDQFIEKKWVRKKFIYEPIELEEEEDKKK